MERMAEAVASGMGSVAFVVIGSAIIVGWCWSTAPSPTSSAPSAISRTGGNSMPSPPEPDLLRVAFYTGDNGNEEASVAHREELSKAQADLLAQNAELTTQIHDMARKPHALTEDVHAATCGGNVAHG
jgi:hypothetical protein